MPVSKIEAFGYWPRKDPFTKNEDDCPRCCCGGLLFSCCFLPGSIWLKNAIFCDTGDTTCGTTILGYATVAGTTAVALYSAAIGASKYANNRIQKRRALSDRLLHEKGE